MMLIANSLEQHSIPMKIQELLLAAGEPSHIDSLCGVDAHSLEGWVVSDRIAVVLEANEPAIEGQCSASKADHSRHLVAPRWLRPATACSDLLLGARDYRRP